MKTIKFILVVLLIQLIISCSNDDQGVRGTNVLTTFDFTAVDPNQIPDVIFANDQNGNLIAELSLGGVPDVYQLTSDELYLAGNFTLSLFNESSSGTEKSLSTFYQVPVGQTLQIPESNYQYDGELKLNFDLSGTTNHQVNVYGLRRQFIDQSDDGAGQFSYTFAYNEEASANRLFIKLRYTEIGGMTRYAHLWVNDYTSSNEYFYTIPDFAETLLNRPTLNDEADDYSGFDLYGVLNGFNCNLYDPVTRDFYTVTEGFDNYLIRYYGGYTDDYTHQKRIVTNTFPENITTIRPNWDMNYSFVNNALAIEVNGQFSLLTLRTSYENTPNDINWDLYAPPVSGTYNLPELPSSLSADYQNHFNSGNPFDQDYAPMSHFTAYPNYNNLIINYLSNRTEHDGDERLIKYF
ncbi:hypothetical protein [Aquimarina brevivitae]|uniref:Uncharacterized protein n=1 Tax=Aquimarina brevivitae TaxID=323412 RepID=A0A4Q7PFH7_9FLAO|nr:hypothetical protein [Aquimarina brevivitae]RZS99226.1 hypothetical protein EV197_0435 [Aquimarina brevivitae]